MKTISLSILAIASVQTCMAQGTSCPMEIEHIVSGSLHLHSPVVFAVKLTNTSGRDIRGFKIQRGYFDATEDLHVVPVELGSHRGVKDGKRDSPQWPNPFPESSGRGIAWVVVIKKVLFEDGSAWVASESQPCYTERWADKKHPRLTKLPWELFTVKETVADRP